VTQPEARTGVLDQILHVSGGFSEAERQRVLKALAELAPHISRWDPADMELDVSVKARDGKEQKVSIRAILPGYPILVGTAVDRDLDRALADARRDLIRQIEEEKKKRQPKDNRHLRHPTMEP
jgi:ribosome-associated translation inhibitor RaiA